MSRHTPRARRAWLRFPPHSLSIARRPIGTMRAAAASSMRRRPPPTRSRFSSSSSSSSLAAFQEIPILSLPPADGSTDLQERDFAERLRHACHTVGFFYVREHGVGGGTYSRALASSRAFFALDLESKLSIDYRNSPSFRGYMQLGTENTAGRADRREQIEFGVEGGGDRAGGGRRPFYRRLEGPNQWPDEHVPSLRGDVSSFMSEMEVLARRIMEYLALGLRLPRSYFNDTFRDRPNVQLKICRSPPVDAASDDDDGGFGVGAHTDSGYLSLLLQDGVGGLQVQNGAGTWIDAPPIDRTVVVNLGEMLQLVTGGYFLATPHRVRSGRVVGDGSDPARYSLPYFWNPRLDFRAVPIDPLPPGLEWQRPDRAADAARRTSPHGDAGPENRLLTCYGENAFKSLARSHPQVMRRHHSDLEVLRDGSVRALT